MDMESRYQELKLALFGLARQLIREGETLGIKERWFLGNGILTLLIICESDEDMTNFSLIFSKFLEDKRDEEIKEKTELGKMAKNVDQIHIKDIPEIMNLLKDIGISLN
jgi:hypothetical protein